jgi:ADP-heptose:LPS heptosyltransferase
MEKILIKTYGFIGDILFASSIAEKLKQEKECVVDYCIGFPQPYKLLKNNPWIDNVYLSQQKGPYAILPYGVDISQYDYIFELPECQQDISPTTWYQQHCGIKSPSPEFKIYTDPIIDESVKYELDQINLTGVKVIGYVANWENLTAIYTESEYNIGLNNRSEIMSHNNQNRRNIKRIIEELNNEYIMIPLGYDASVTQYHTSLDSTSTYTNTASIIKYCDLVIGQEGGLTNLAAGVGTRCIITTDFMHALYGPNGIMKQYPKVKLGPANLFPNSNHINLNPFITDDEIINTIKNEI